MVSAASALWLAAGTSELDFMLRLRSSETLLAPEKTSSFNRDIVEESSDCFTASIGTPWYSNTEAKLCG